MGVCWQGCGSQHARETFFGSSFTEPRWWRKDPLECETAVRVAYTC